MQDAGDPWASRTYPIEEDMPTQRATWRVERIAWVGFALVGVGALLGIFGDGVLARTVAEDPTGRLQVEYERIERQQSPSTLRIRASGLASGSEAAIRYGRDLADFRSFEAVEPHPARAFSDGSGLVHVYAVPESGSLVIQVDYNPLRPGISTGTIAIGSGPALTLRQFVLP
jgi:hypothetical protein